MSISLISFIIELGIFGDSGPTKQLCLQDGIFDHLYPGGFFDRQIEYVL